MEFDILKRMGDSGSDAFFIYHLSENRFTYLNQMASRIWERPSEWFLTNTTDLVHAVHADDQQKLVYLFQQLQNDTPFIHTEARIVVASGMVKTLNLKGYAVTNSAGERVLVGFAEDITAQKMHETYLLEFGNKKNSILEILAHDMAGPLHIAKNLANTLEKEGSDQSTTTAEYARIIQQVCDQSINLIANLLSEEHQKSPMIRVKMELVNLVKLLRLVVQPYQLTYQNQYSIEVLANANKILAEVDKIKFSQIVNNLISNAIKFSPANSRIGLTLTDTGPEVLLRVDDNGIGIPENLQPFMFFNHSKASRPGLRGEKSKGVGLHISKTLAEMMHGKIWFESKENAGASFYVLLPKTYQGNS